MKSKDNLIELIKNSIAKSNLHEAIRLIEESEFSHLLFSDLAHVKLHYNELSSSITKSIISHEEYLRGMNKVLNQLIGILDKIKAIDAKKESKEDDKKIVLDVTAKQDNFHRKKIDDRPFNMLGSDGEKVIYSLLGNSIGGWKNFVVTKDADRVDIELYFSKESKYRSSYSNDAYGDYKISVRSLGSYKNKVSDKKPPWRKKEDALHEDFMTIKFFKCPNLERNGPISFEVSYEYTRKIIKEVYEFGENGLAYTGEV